MEEYENHFIDSSIIIASLIHWDSTSNRATSYFSKLNCHRHASDRVYYECRHVIESRRRYALNFFAEFNRNIEDISSHWNLEYTIRKFINSYISKLRNEKEKEAIIVYSQVIMDDLKDMALGSRNYSRIKREIMSSFKSILNELDLICNSSGKCPIMRHSCPEMYTYSEYSKKEDMLMRNVNYKPDVLILLDSYYIKEKIIRTEMAFITFDREHILNNRREIERILPGIYVFSPP